MDSEVGWVLEMCRTCWKNLKTRRPDPSDPPSGAPAQPPKAESTLSKPKPVAPKPPDVLDATFGDSDDDDDSNGGDNEEEDGGGHNEDPEEESHAEASCSPTCFSHVTHALSTSSLPPMRRQYPPMSIKIVAAHRKCDACHAPTPLRRQQNALSRPHSCEIERNGKYFVGNVLTLSEGELHKKRCLENDAATNASTWYCTRQARRLKGMELFNRCSNRVDRHNHHRQSILALEEVWHVVKLAWYHRPWAALIGIIETDSFFSFTHF